jgi:hypothetical protein
LVGQSHFLTLRPVGRSQKIGRTKSIIDSSIFHMKERVVNRVVNRARNKGSFWRCCFGRIIFGECLDKYSSTSHSGNFAQRKSTRGITSSTTPAYQSDTPAAPSLSRDERTRAIYLAIAARRNHKLLWTVISG